MLKIILSIWISLFFLQSSAQVSISTDGSSPHPNAMLEIKAINKGLLLPRGDANTRNLLSTNTAKGLLLFDTTRGTVWVHNGNGTANGWKEVQDEKSGLWIKNGNDISSNNLPNGNVAIGLPNTSSRLEVLGNATTSPVIRSVVGYSGSSDVRAIEGRSFPITGYGIGGYFEAGYQGLRVIGNPEGGPGTSYGVYSTVANSTVASTKYGMYTSVTGLGTNYGLFTNTTGGTNNYSIYASNGNTYLKDSLWIGKTTGETRFDMAGGIGNVQYTEGDFKIGTATNRLKMGVYTSGGTPGQSRIMAAGSNASLIFGTNTTDIVAIFPNANGTVVIGNGAGVSQYATGYKLNVHGKIVCTEVMVKNISAWPDYVFDKEYKLPALQDVKSFIEKNKHLPGIPAASTVEKEGLMLADMQHKLLQKVEELTLYILKQADEIDLLKKGLQDIKYPVKD